MSASHQEEQKNCHETSFIDEYPGLMNESDKTLLDLGIGKGPLVLPLCKKGWTITGYDRDAESLVYLQSHKVNAKQQDLNKLNYQEMLVSDLRKTTNVVMINLAPFLNEPALAYLLFNLMDHAQSNTVFLFVNAFLPKVKSPEECRKVFALPQNYVTSFFAPRTDMAFLKRTTQNFGNYFNDVVFIKKY